MAGLRHLHRDPVRRWSRRRRLDKWFIREFRRWAWRSQTRFI